MKEEEERTLHSFTSAFLRGIQMRLWLFIATCECINRPSLRAIVHYVFFNEFLGFQVFGFLGFQVFRFSSFLVFGFLGFRFVSWRKKVQKSEMEIVSSNNVLFYTRKKKKHENMKTKYPEIKKWCKKPRKPVLNTHSV